MKFTIKSTFFIFFSLFFANNITANSFSKSFVLGCTSGIATYSGIMATSSILNPGKSDSNNLYNLAVFAPLAVSFAADIKTNSTKRYLIKAAVHYGGWAIGMISGALLHVGLHNLSRLAQ